jgi:hypothetical protein
LGFNLDAYVIIGTNMNENHAWVLTKSEEKNTFWESITG